MTQPQDVDKAQKYLDWLLTPRGHRQPTSKQAFADGMGVSNKTLYNWERSDWFQSEMRAAKATFGVRWYGDILNRLKDVLDSGSDKDSLTAARILLQYLELPERQVDEKLDEKTVLKALQAAGFQILSSDVEN